MFFIKLILIKWIWGWRYNCKKVLNNNLMILLKRDSGLIFIRKWVFEILGDFRIYNLFDVIIGL